MEHASSLSDIQVVGPGGAEACLGLVAKQAACLEVPYLQIRCGDGFNLDAILDAPADPSLASLAVCDQPEEASGAEADAAEIVPHLPARKCKKPERLDCSVPQRFDSVGFDDGRWLR